MTREFHNDSHREFPLVMLFSLWPRCHESVVIPRLSNKITAIRVNRNSATFVVLFCSADGVELAPVSAGSAGGRGSTSPKQRTADRRRQQRRESQASEAVTATAAVIPNLPDPVHSLPVGRVTAGGWLALGPEGLGQPPAFSSQLQDRSRWTSVCGVRPALQGVVSDLLSNSPCRKLPWRWGHEYEKVFHA
jgi:hypothetical protein